MSEFVVDEGVESVWTYHIRKGKKPETDGSGYRALCGHQLLGKELPIETWGHKSEHIPQRYCDKCDALFRGERSANDDDSQG